MLPTMITISGVLEIAPGTPDSSASVTFKRRLFVSHSDGTVIEPGSQVVAVASDGSFEIEVMATNDPAWTPVGWTYRISIDTGEGTPFGYEAAVPYDASGGTLTIGEVLPAGSISQGVLYAAAGHTHPGYVSDDELAAVAISGEYDDLTGKPTIPSTKADVGLGNVDNTSDATKPVSTPQQTALNLKANTSAISAVGLSGAYVDLTGKPTIPATYSDLTGTVPQGALPAIAYVEFLGSVANQAAMLALTGQRGDWAFRSDLGTDWQLIAEPSSVLGNWQERHYPASPVSSVFGRVGAVVGAKADVGLGNVDNTADSAKPVSTPQQTAIDGRINVQDFTVSGTWTNPSPSVARLVVVEGTSSGCGGGSGRRGAAGTLRTGGASGAPGSPFRAEFLSTDLPATVAITVGVALAGGAAPTTDDTDGNPGIAGGTGNTLFGAYATYWVGGINNSALGGGRGGNATGAAASGLSAEGGLNGAGSSATGGVGVAAGGGAQSLGLPLRSATGGGSGAGLPIANTESVGGVGGSYGGGTKLGGAAGAVNGGNGGTGATNPSKMVGGLGGGGGGSNDDGGGGRGGDGGYPGGGGGGAGAGTNGTTGQPGGTGAAGFMRVTTY